LIYRAKSKVRTLAGKSPVPWFDWQAQELDTSEKGRLFIGATTDLSRLIYQHEGRLVHKWLHYPDLYDRHFVPFRGTPLKMLEIGVFEGGSLEIWRRYFGVEATIYGIDINPDCADRVSEPNQVRIGSQADPAFLRSVVEEMGALDIVLDDGSHIAAHQWASFETLFPMMKEGGLYVIEDLHTSYWPGFHQGGYRRAGSAIEMIKSMIDDLHGWYHRKNARTAAGGSVAGIHIYDSIVFIEKRLATPPQHIRVP
jgi:hypothetical protein